MCWSLVVEMAEIRSQHSTDITGKWTRKRTNDNTVWERCWREAQGAIPPCRSLSDSWERAVSSKQLRGPHVSTAEGQASRRLEAINRAMAGSVPSCLTSRQGYFLQRERVVSSPWTECTLPSIVHCGHQAAKAQDLPLCRASAPLMQSATAALHISHHR